MGPRDRAIVHIVIGWGIPLRYFIIDSLGIEKAWMIKSYLSYLK